MYSVSVYYFSKWTFFITSVFLIMFSIGIAYFSLLFYPDAWQYSLLFASPLLIPIFILPEYIKTFYFLLRNRPALILTKDQLIDKFKGKEYNWTDINRVELKPNKGRAPGGYIALYLTNSKETVQIADVKLKGKKFEILDDLQVFLEKYGAKEKAL